MDELMSNSSDRILICDDSLTNTYMLSELLKQEINAETTCFNDPRLVEEAITEHRFSLVILDLEMPHLSGFEVMQKIRNIYGPDQLPILIVTGLEGKDMRNRALGEGANDFINKPLDPVEIVLRSSNQLRIHQSYRNQKVLNGYLEKKVEERTRELNSSVKAILHSFAMVGELKDDETGQHVKRVGKYARILAKGYGLPDELANLIELAAPLHDIGKVGIPESILLKPGRLDPEERRIMNKHTIFGQELLAHHHSDVMQMAGRIAATHHERWDGTGYHMGLKGESIPIEGRITMVADVFDALTTRRPYKEPWPVPKAVKYIQEASGHMFDPHLVEIFDANLDSFLDIRQRYQDALLMA